MRKTKRKIKPVYFIYFFVPILLIAIFCWWYFLANPHIKTQTTTVEQNVTEAPASSPTQPEKVQLKDGFDQNLTLEETGKMGDSKSTGWWLNSGAYLYERDGIASTVRGSLEKSNRWRQLYNKNNAGETDNGYHPQNIFRLVTRSKWQDFEQEAYFKIINNNFSADAHRDASNGLLLFNRYQDGNNLYYTGVRVDGTAVIKKKINSNYFTMIQQNIFSGKYDRATNTNLLPQNSWIGVKSQVKTNDDDTVSITVFVDKNRTGNWEKAAEAIDDGKAYGGKPFLTEGYAGIRTDFMDVEFDDYKIVEE